MSDYTPINCDIYDHLEIFAMKNLVVDISFSDDDKIVTVSDRITNIIAQNKEEFVILASGRSIRLDRLITVGNIPFKDEQKDTSCTNDTTFRKN